MAGVERDPPALPRPMSTLRRMSGALAAAILAGAVAGAIVGGIGSRLVMRILALTNDDRVGVLTDSSATVGEISLSGTVQLLALGTIIGILGGLLYLGLRRWLFVPTAFRGLAFGALTLSTFGNIVLDPANVDFQIFEPVLLVVGLFAALFVLNGVIVSRLADRMHPEPAYAPGVRAPAIAGAVLGLLGVLGLFILAGTVVTMIDDAGTCEAAVGGGAGCAAFATD